MVGFCERFPSHSTTLSAWPTQLLVGQLTRLPFRSGYATALGWFSFRDFSIELVKICYMSGFDYFEPPKCSHSFHRTMHSRIRSLPITPSCVYQSTHQFINPSISSN